MNLDTRLELERFERELQQFNLNLRLSRSDVAFERAIAAWLDQLERNGF